MAIAILSTCLRSSALQIVAALLFFQSIDAQQVPDDSWTMWGGDLNNTRSAEGSTLINQTSANNLTVAWKASLLGAVSASPLIFEGAAVFPTWAGQVYSLNSSTGTVLWQTTIDDYISSPLCDRPTEYNITASGVISRTTPTLAAPDIVVIGTQLVVAQELLAGLPYLLGLLPCTVLLCSATGLQDQQAR